MICLGLLFVIYKKVVSSSILLGYMLLIELVLTVNLLIFLNILRLRCGSEYTCGIKFRVIVLRDIDNDIDLSLVVTINPN